MTDKELIKQEIERIIEEETPISKGSDYYHGTKESMEKLLQFIDSLQEEHNEDLKEEFNRFLDEEGVPRMWHSDEQMEWGMDIARHFAEWQKKKDQETIELAEDHAMLAGMMKEREEMMKDAVEGEVHKGYVGNQIVVSSKDGISNYVAFDASYADAFCVGDKVKIIIVKED